MFKIIFQYQYSYNIFEFLSRHFINLKSLNFILALLGAIQDFRLCNNTSCMQSQQNNILLLCSVYTMIKTRGTGKNYKSFKIGFVLSNRSDVRNENAYHCIVISNVFSRKTEKFSVFFFFCYSNINKVLQQVTAPLTTPRNDCMYNNIIIFKIFQWKTFEINIFGTIYVCKQVFPICLVLLNNNKISYQIFGYIKTNR